MSFGSGIPTVFPLRTRIFKGLGLSDGDISLLEEKGLPFETIFEVLMSAANCDRLMEVFRGFQPGLAHRLFARLAQRGIARTAVTTNFDTLLERALDDLRVPFDLYSSDEVFATIDWAQPRIRVIKLHGSLENADKLAITIRRVAAKYFVEQREQVIQKLIEHDGAGGLIVLGYSCSDHFDVSPTLRRYARNDRRVWYVAHSASSPAPLVPIPLAAFQPINPFVRYDSWSVGCVTDDLLRAVWRTTGEEPPTLSAHGSNDWETTVDRWLDSLTSGGEPGMKHYVAGLLLKAGNLWDQSNRYLNDAIALGLTEATMSRALLAMGNNHRDLRHDLTEAQRVLERADSVAIASRNFAIAARVANSLGMVAADLNDLPSAITAYERALNLLADDRELEGKCHGNLGIALKNRHASGDLDEALKHQKLAYEVAQEIGDKRSEGRTLGNIGLVLTKMDDLNSSCEYYRKARAIAEALGDQLHVGIWLHNEGEDTAASNPVEAISLLSQAKDIFAGLNQQAYADESSRVIATIYRATGTA